ncbi:MAG TPA: MFS transporter [Rhizomicrobium sp.]|nr:MFS transporter [Rhizomicrobium sp.]
MTVAADQTAVAPSRAEPWPKPAQAWYAVFIFALALMMDFLDRGVIGFLVHPIETDLHLSDSQIGLVTGLAYVGFYAFIALPIARLADTRKRRTIVGVGVVVWSAATALCGFAQNFWQLFLARMGVGAGEACNGPPVFSMISDLFPREKLPRAIAVLNFGFIAGTGLASIFAGGVIRFFSSMPPVVLPFVGALHPWQMTFIAVGIPGVIIGLLMWTVKEPIRRGRISKDKAGMPIGDIVKFFVDNRATYAPMFLGLGFNMIPSVGLIFWSAEYFRRSFHMQPADYALYAGAISVVVAPIGAIFGSRMAEKFYAAGRDDANIRVVLLAFLFNVPGLIGLTLAPTPQIAFAIFAYTQFVAMWVPGPFNAALQVVTPNEMRAQITALFLFIFNIIGYGLGPSVVAFITQYVFHDPAMLRYSLTTVMIILMPPAAISLWWGMKAYGESVARAKTWD